MSAADKNTPAPTVAPGLTDREIRLRLIEAASRAPISHSGHKDGAAASMIDVAAKWHEWVKSGTLGLPTK